MVGDFIQLLGQMGDIIRSMGVINSWASFSIISCLAVSALFSSLHVLHHLGNSLRMKILQNIQQHHRLLPGELDGFGKEAK